MGGMFEILRNAFKIQNLRKKIFFTLAMLIIYRIGCHLPVPGLDSNVFKDIVTNQQGSIFGLVDIFTGGAFSNATLFAMGITPYINSSIIIQLLTVAIPYLERLSKEGDEGRKKLGQYMRLGTVILGFVQAAAITWSIRGSLKSSLTVLTFLLITLTLTAGTAFLMWLGEQITEYGIGNGISWIIFVNILSRGPSAAVTLINMVMDADNKIITFVFVLVILALFVLVIAAVIWVNEAERRIPVQYTKRVVGRKMYGGQLTHIPIKVNWAGVIPIIFAMSVMMLPSTLIGFFWANSTNGVVVWFKNWPNQLSYSFVYAILIMLFTFFYTYIQFNPVEIANNLQKNGGFIAGYRPGQPTAAYISKVLYRLTWFGALFLAVIQIFPAILGHILGPNYRGLWFGGTSVLILVGVALDTVRAVESQMLMNNYRGFLE